MIELGSVNLVVRDMAAAERFYVEVLGLRVDPERSNRPSFVLLRAANCMIILQQAKSIDSESGIELAFAVDDVDGMKQKLGDRAVVQQMGWGNAIETTDPEGTRLNLFRLVPNSAAGRG
jgi:catechol 2,3-dioxygenase-like lactoylglutathione lyase family enzyme